MVKPQTYRYQNQNMKEIPWCSAVLTAANVIIFLVCQFTGDWLYIKGEFGAFYLIRSQEYYRLVTAMFLHADIRYPPECILILSVRAARFLD